MADENTPKLLIDGELFEGWTEIRVTRGMDRAASDFVLAVARRWPGQDQDFPLQCFQPCELLIGEDRVITGYIDTIEAMMDARTHTVRVAGRSKTMDLIDCHNLLEGGEFRDSTFGAICAAVAAPFGIEISDPWGAGAQRIPAEAADQMETAFNFLERLARGAGCLLTDDEAGRLVLGRLGEGEASEPLVLGQNVLAATVTLAVEKRFDQYVVKGQAPTASAWYSELDSGGQPGVRPGTRARPGLNGVVRDEAVPRYRPFVMQAEGGAEGADMQARALWQARRDAAESVSIKCTVQGWRQKDGRLWQVNERARVVMPELGAGEDELLIASVSHELTAQRGRQTILTLQPPEAFTPEPTQPRAGGSGGGAWYSELAPASGR